MDLPIDYTKADWRTRREAREAYVRKQGGKCLHCGRPLSGPPSMQMRAKRINRKLFPPTFWKYPVHLHHCHSSGMTIGAVHNQCNAVLWQYHGE